MPLTNSISEPSLLLRKTNSIDMKIKELREKNIEPKLNPPYIESINYFMYEYLKDRKDKRMKLLFDYVIVPNSTDPLFDFNDITFEEFFKFLIDIKEK